MSDAAFKTGAFPAYTNEAMIRWLSDHINGVIPLDAAEFARICAEVDRRGRVASGDTSVMTPGERLRHARAQEG